MGGPKVPKEQKAAMRAQAEQLEALKNLPLPELQKLALTNPELVGLLEAEQLGPSALEDIQTDPRLKETQMQALQQIKERAQQGLTAEDKLGMEQMLGQADAAAKARQEGLKQEMARRGTLDSGAQLAASLAGQQGAASNARQQAMQMAAQSSANRAQAAQQMAGMASGMEQADYGRQANAASAKDRIAQANAAARMQTNQQNLAARQAIENQKAALRNQETTYNIGRDQQQFQNELAKLGAQQSTINASAQMAASMPKKAGLGATLGGLAGAAMGASAGPSGMLAGYSAGTAIGGGVDNMEDGGTVHAQNGTIVGDQSGYDSMQFNEAFKKARELNSNKGGGTFSWRGKNYNTNMSGENTPIDNSVVDMSGGIGKGLGEEAYAKANENNNTKLLRQTIEGNTQDKQPSSIKKEAPLDINSIFDFNRMQKDIEDSSKIENGKAVGMPNKNAQTEGYGTDKTATEITQPQGSESTSKDKSDFDSVLSMSEKILKSQKQEPPKLNLDTNVQFGQPQNVLAERIKQQDFSNPFAQQQAQNPFAAKDGGTYYHAENGDLMHKSSGKGDIVQGDSFANDRVDAKLNSGEMVLNVTQQQRLMDLLRGKAKIEDLGDKDIVEGVPKKYQEDLKAKNNLQNGGKVLSQEELDAYNQAESMGEQDIDPMEEQVKKEAEARMIQEEAARTQVAKEAKDRAIQQGIDQQSKESPASVKDNTPQKLADTEEFDPSSEYKKILQEYNKLRQTPDENSKVEMWAAIGDILNQTVANADPYYKPITGVYESIKKQQADSKKEKLDKISTMAELLNKYKQVEAKAQPKEVKKTKLQEEKEKLTAKRYSSLEEQIPERMANIEEAKELKKLIESDKLDTGVGQETLGKIGNLFATQQSAYKERLDALAEKAARAALKANGETRPTDADVEGMKKAMFNLGNTEATNIKKLQDFIEQQQSGIDEYSQMKSKIEKGEGLEDFILKKDINTDKPRGKIKVQMPDGQIGYIPKDNLQDLLKKHPKSKILE